MAKTRSPAYWEDRAEEILARMEEARHEATKRILFRIYHDYIRLARLAEEELKAGEEALTPLPFSREGRGDALAAAAHALSLPETGAAKQTRKG
jgi:hypothetical protein